MINKKRSLELFAFILVFFVIFSACSSNNTTNNNTEANDNNTEANDNNNNEPINNDTTNNNKNEETYSEDEWVKIVQLAGSGQIGQIYKDADIERVQTYIAENTGAWVEIILPAAGARDDTLNLLLASGDQLNIFDANFQDYYQLGAIKPIDPDKFHVAAKTLDDFHPEWREYTSDEYGNIWGIPGIFPITGNPVQIRSDFLEQVDLPAPTTIDELETVLEAFKANDVSEALLMTTELARLRRTLMSGWLPDGEAGNWINSDDEVMPVQLHPGYFGFIEKMTDWYDKGYIYSEAFNTSTGGARDMVAQGKVAAMAAWHSLVNMAPTDDYELLRSYIIIPDLKGPEGYCQKRRFSLTDLGAAGLVTSSTTDEEYEAVANYVNWIYTSHENFFSLSKGIPGVDFEKKVLDNGYIGMKIINEELYRQTNIAPFQTFTSYWHTTLGGMLNQEDEISPGYEYNYEHILQDNKYSKVSGDFYFRYDKNKLKNDAPNMSDIDTMIASEETKFITGVRPLDEWDDYIDELYQAGLDKWIEAHTVQWQAR